MIKPEVAAANKSHSDLWLTGAVRVIFMSYYIPLAGLDDEGLGKAWDGLDVVSTLPDVPSRDCETSLIVSVSL